MDHRKLISEEAKMRTLKRIVDDCAARLANPGMTDEEASRFIESTRSKVLGLFPGKEEQFELIYRPRFARIIAEKRKGQVSKHPYI